MTITTTDLPNAIAKDVYAGVLTVSGSCSPYTWRVASGSLPGGITMSKSSSPSAATLSGTPSTAGTYSFTVSAKSCSGSVARVACKIVVQAAPNHVVDLSWKGSTSGDIAGYNVYRAPDGISWSKINPSLTASTLYSDSTVANSSTYYYAATAVSTSGQESAKSNIAKSAIP